MFESLIDYSFDKTTVANADGTFVMQVDKASVVSGPGTIATGTYPKAVDLGTSGTAKLELSGLGPDFGAFSIRVIFQATTAGGRRQNLLESTLLPFSLSINGRAGSNTFDLVGAVAPKAHGWQTASTEFATGLKPGRWYTAELVYDEDTLGVFVDGTIVSVHAFPQGTLAKGAGNHLFLGSWVDGRRNHFNGKIAALRWTSGIPDELASQLDERRSHPQWFITHKVLSARKRIDLGRPTGKISYIKAVDAYIQHYDRGAYMFQDGLGTAFEMHGAIYAKYQSMRNRNDLGYLASDEETTTRRGGRKSIFSRGAIYWSSATGAIPVLGQLYLDYENLGESRTFGYPTRAARTVSGGLEQVFQSARMYYKNGATNAHSVRGAILQKLLKLGGVAKWGFPVTNESDVKNGKRVIGKYSEFETCTIYWSSASGAFEVHGDIRRRYGNLGGPASDLGFPTSDERSIPGVSGPGRYNTFQKGSILWYGTYNGIQIARPFNLFIGRINTDESEGAFMGQNDLYIKVTVKDGNKTVYNKKHPKTGDWGGRNIRDVNLTIPVVLTPNTQKTIQLIVDVWESDSGAPFGGGDDHIGKWTKNLNAANAWGLRENNGILNSGSFSKINSIKASVQPKVNFANLSDTEKFWGVKNKGTPTLSYQQYASAFRDVDSDTEWWDVTDWLEKAFYELVIDTIAGSGNCFGMSLEAIYARKGSSLFSMPINRFKKWETVLPEFNVKHQYQVGAGPIWWFLGQFASGNTHDPKDVFRETRAEFKRGSHPVLCLSQNYDFSGSPHCVLPIAWDSSSKPWKITISDPNFPNQLKVITVDPDKNEFKYVSSSSRVYRGGEWSGGRLHYMPFSMLDSPPRTPIWDAILMILAGTIIILGDDSQTTSITDGEGSDLDAYGTRALNELKAGKSLNNYFVGFKGFDQRGVVRPVVTPAGRLVLRPLRPAGGVAAKARGTVPGELLMRMRPKSSAAVVGPAAISPAVVAHLPLNALRTNRDLRSVSDAIVGTGLARTLGNRTLHHVVNDPAAMAEIDRRSRETLERAVAATNPASFQHRVQGLRKGSLQYAVKHGLSQFRLGSTMNAAESNNVAVNDIGTSKNTVIVDSPRDKQVALEVEHKLGVGPNKIKIKVEGIPVARAAALQMNLKPGLGGFDLLTQAQRVNAPVSIDAVIDGRTVKRRFNIPLEGGTRVKLSTILGDNAIAVSTIDNIFGPSRDATVIRGRP